jgi:hypothetical protein
LPSARAENAPYQYIYEMTASQSPIQSNAL